MIVVVTAAIGTTETPPPPKFLNPVIRYVCGSDRESIPGWERLPTAAFTPQRTARGVKMMAPAMFPDDTVIWCDASFDWIETPAALALQASLMDCDLAAFAHPDRQRITQEADEVIRCGLAPTDDAKRQVSDYRAEGFDTDENPQQALTTTGLIVFSPGPKLDDFMLLWSMQIEVYTVRDQLSVDYCAWKTGIRIAHLPGHYRSNSFVRYNRERHRSRRAA